ncbi:SDR family NAD(P)-dependent oxidoreductase [Ensifer sp. ENS02]|uniref:SDR family NAD(P)-dependent oxidoreductase n=1 Tax=Ensifer sp. ENS02 TaxID=2769290 RepID=UPI002484E906|nr:SDR family NAD(P)-dependent oxidoreductase [Ensifer sp. ENS02]
MAATGATGGLDAAKPEDRNAGARSLRSGRNHRLQSQDGGRSDRRSHQQRGHPAQCPVRRPALRRRTNRGRSRYQSRRADAVVAAASAEDARAPLRHRQCRLSTRPLSENTAAVYSATKAGLRMFSDALSVQHQAGAVKVVDVVLPLVDTPMTSGRGKDKVSAAYAAKEILRALEPGGPRIHVGKARLLRLLEIIAPPAAAAIIRKL